MPKEKNLVIRKKHVKVCSNNSCNFAEFQEGSHRCWKCGGTVYIYHFIASLGDKIIPSLSIAKENPPARPRAASSGFMQLI